MAKIIAKGVRFARPLTVVCEERDGFPTLEIDGIPAFDQEYFSVLVENPPAIGGTYYPEPGTMLAAFAVLEQEFFDRGSDVEISIEGNIGEIPADGPTDAVY